MRRFGTVSNRHYEYPKGGTIAISFSLLSEYHRHPPLFTVLMFSRIFQCRPELFFSVLDQSVVGDPATLLASKHCAVRASVFYIHLEYLRSRLFTSVRLSSPTLAPRQTDAHTTYIARSICRRLSSSLHSHTAVCTQSARSLHTIRPQPAHNPHTVRTQSCNPQSERQDGQQTKSWY